MPVPNYPGKFDSTPLVTPDQSHATGPTQEDHAVPDHIAICFSQQLFEYITDTYDGDRITRYLGDIYVISETVGVLGNFGIGAPTTAMQMEELIADGAQTFLAIGFAGALDTSIDLGEFILCEKALRDDGTSHHYLEPNPYAYPSDTLLSTTEQALQHYDQSYHVGPTWTIDAIYRETVAEIDHYADQDILTVEMEAAAVFAVATHRNIDAAAIFVISDYLTPENWTPHFDTALKDLYTLADTSIDILQTHLD